MEWAEILLTLTICGLTAISILIRILFLLLSKIENTGKECRRDLMKLEEKMNKNLNLLRINNRRSIQDVYKILSKDILNIKK